ncbi:desaturase [Bradyrhizobium centrolobii]|uniref:Desaturase n=1 Tax=Bradyrhizobium centrolobii TaxID=1505087 RepID=A0A176Z1W7_9BRAD|nr:sterol desaturase family protein [Bradyrhizobium centrolobii]OAF14078.1 desaturase [Bradyrhizobium centrolobii]
MDDTMYGRRDKRGNWEPNNRSMRTPPIFVWPIRVKKVLVWLPGYIWPYNTIYFVITLVAWGLTPSLEAMRDFEVGWVSLILLRNAVLTLLVYGGLHTLLYIQRRQQTDFKYNVRWPDTNNSTFLFGSQTAENVFWSMCSGVPVWTAYEVFTWWAFANGYIPYVDFRQHPIYFIGLMLLVPLWTSLHFYLIHRLIHMGPLYHLVHKLHHKNVNPAPWSGLSMHPVEHLLYFSGVLIYLVVPSHPLHVVFYLIRQALGAVQGHYGFHRIETVDGKYFESDHYFHYLHHKYFEVNYGTELVPLDAWFGTLHDGSSEADETMYKRVKAKKYAR